jgi:hypothetical protein
LWPYSTAKANIARFSGSEQEFADEGILGCFLEGHEFGLGRGHPLSLQQEITQIFVPAATPQQALDISVHGFDNPHGHFGAAVVENSRKPRFNAPRAADSVRR